MDNKDNTQELIKVTQQLNDLQIKFNMLQDLFYRFRQTGKYQVVSPMEFSESAYVGFYGKASIKQPATIADPTGGGTVDTQSRTAINSLIDRLQDLGLIK